MSINRVNISGNLTRDPELRATQSGMQVLSFGVAVNDRRRNQQTGEWEDYANFVDCTMFGNRAESVSRFLSKGAKVAIDGKLRWSQWERDGQKRSKLEVVVDDLEFMSRQSVQDGAQGGYGQQAGGYAYGGGYAQQAASQRPQGGYGYGQPAPQQQYQQQAQAAPQPAPASSVYEQTYDIYSEDLPF